MSSLAEYFAEHRPKPKYSFGDRVEGTHQKIPYVGTVYTDNMRNELEGPMVSVHLDLPMKIGKEWHNRIRVAYKEIKGLRTCTKD
jgi:hypothetical protein